MLRKLKIVDSRQSTVDRLLSYRINILLGMVSAVLLALAFSSFNISFFIWIGLVPLFFAIDGKTPKQAFLISYLCGFLFFLLSMYWLVFVSPLGWIALSLYQALYVGLFGAFFSIVHCPLSTVHILPSTIDRRPSTMDCIKPRPYILLPAAWCVLEYLRSNIGGGIGWNSLGYAEYQNIPIIQIADITGVYGVSFLIILLNLAVFSTIKMAISCQKTHKRLFAKSNLSFTEEIKAGPFFEILAISLLIAAVLIYGYKKIELYDKKDASSHILKVSVVQGNIQQMYKWDPDYRYYIMEKYEDLTLEAAKESPDIIIWPETAVPGYLNNDAELQSYINDIARISMSTLLVGAPTVKIAGEKELSEYNSALLFTKSGNLINQHDKLYLVLFGEYIPLERYLPFLRRLLPITGSFSPGSEYTLFSLQPSAQRSEASPKGTTYNLQPAFGTLICFEDIFPNLVRRFVQDGADFMVNITNDAWFNETAAAYQHAANSVLRAVENRRPFVRSANTGLSCFIDTAGRIYDRVSFGGKDLFVDGYKTATVKITPGAGLSFYTRFGDIFIIICSLLTGLFLFDYLRQRRYNK